MSIDQYSPQSGRFLTEDGKYINVADVLGGTETGQMADIEKYTPHSERFINNDAVPACNMTAEIIADTKMYIDNKLSG